MGILVLRLLSVIGARPNFVKLAAVEPYLRKHVHIIVHTGQHYDYELSQEVFLDDLGLKAPDYHLDVGSGTHRYRLLKNMWNCRDKVECVCGVRSRRSHCSGRFL